MKTFALSLLAVAASASYGYGGYGGHAASLGAGYGHFASDSSYTSPYRKSSSKYSARPSSHSHHNFHVAPPAPKPVHYHAYPYPHPEPEAEEEEAEEEPAVEPYNPWETPEEEEVDPEAPDTTGWYSPTEQYSPPKIAFRPNATYPVFGICEFSPANAGLNGSIQFAQLPGKATLYQASLFGAIDTSYDVSIMETGKILGGCADVSMNEFWPLAETDKYGNPNPFQDPARGRIADFVSDGNGEINEQPSFVLANMGGKDGILGRALNVDALNDMGMPIGDPVCCNIVIDENPAKFQPAPYFPSQKYGRAPHGHYRH